MEQRKKFYLFSLFLFLVAVVTWFLPPFRYHYDSLRTHTAESKPSFTAPRQNIWSELSEHESAAVYSFVSRALPHLALVKKPKKGQDNFIYTIETLRPNKTDAMLYAIKNGHLPQRWAKVVIAQNDGVDYVLAYYAVGPLPVSKDTQILLLVA